MENEDRSNPNESRRALTANRPQCVRDNVNQILVKSNTNNKLYFKKGLNFEKF